jgi:aldehyde dehydrogenase (NAD+)
MAVLGISADLEALGISESNAGCSTGTRWVDPQGRRELQSISPVDGERIAAVSSSSADDYAWVMQTAGDAFSHWRGVPAPRRGEIIRQIGQALRRHKRALGRLVSWEMGKPLQEGLGEVQEMIDIADFAVGQSRQLYGATMHSEREHHRMYDQYHPLGVVGVITAFNFPVAVWAWNALIAAVCGETVVWKPSSKVPLSAVAVQRIVGAVMRENDLPEGIFNLIIGSGSDIGDRMLNDRRIPLLSLTGSTRVGRRAASVVGGRLGRIILELGGNNAVILTANADLKLAVPAVVFGAVGTAGQRCTTTRRVIVHESIFEAVKGALVNAYQRLRIGNPLDESSHLGPLIDRTAAAQFTATLERVRRAGGEVITGGRVLEGAGYDSGCYVAPAIAVVDNRTNVVQEETFAPILYLIRYRGGVDAAIAIQNDVPQGLSSAIFTTDLRESETFLSHDGSDCGIANVNIGTSGAEIGGAFGGEKDTGGGREAGSDAWKAYMRRQTNTINYGAGLPLAQGIRFEL